MSCSERVPEQKTWHYAVCLICCVLFVLTQWYLPENPAEVAKHAFRISRGVVIALDAEEGGRVVTDAQRWLHIKNMTSMHAINGSLALENANDFLPLYTRYLLRYGRHDHMQLGNAAMLGCLLSHVEVWRRYVGPNETIAVFEEDARLDETSSERMRQLSLDMRLYDWDMIMLESGHVTTTGEWVNVGTQASRCKVPSECTWFGTRGYIVKYEGVQKLLRRVDPIIVQVDALIGLAASEEGLKLFWTKSDIAHASHIRPSTIWDGCLKCMLPAGHIMFYVGLCFILLFGLVSCILWFYSCVICTTKAILVARGGGGGGNNDDTAMTTTMKCECLKTGAV